MIVLGIETAGPRGSLAVLTPGTPGSLVRSVQLSATRRLGADLSPAIKRLLASAGLGRARVPDLVAVDTGPGSYTGLRIGLAAAKGLAFAWGRPLLGVALVDALRAAAPPADRVLCAVDASRGEVYAVTFVRRGADLVPEAEPALREAGELRASLAGPLTLVGDAAPALADPARGVVAAPDCAWPDAEHVARLAAARFLGGERQDALRICPTYFRANEAEEARRRRSMKQA